MRWSRSGTLVAWRAARVYSSAACSTARTSPESLARNRFAAANARAGWAPRYMLPSTSMPSSWSAPRSVG
ncbi:hypothetical protein, partial [Nocardia cyriacigeorgica]|uniref:hypothetical protein n=1 Tax=Nocardia cyriacigeorgica TaxID=135487 RepID=UPI002453A218